MLYVVQLQVAAAVAGVPGNSQAEFNVGGGVLTSVEIDWSSGTPATGLCGAAIYNRQTVIYPTAADSPAVVGLVSYWGNQHRSAGEVVLPQDQHLVVKAFNGDASARTVEIRLGIGRETAINLGRVIKSQLDELIKHQMSLLERVLSGQ